MHMHMININELRRMYVMVIRIEVINLRGVWGDMGELEERLEMVWI